MAETGRRCIQEKAANQSPISVSTDCEMLRSPSNPTCRAPTTLGTFCIAQPMSCDTCVTTARLAGNGEPRTTAWLWRGEPYSE